ncbi:hypothetical protein CW751_07610 [Brumimicrobium salinarum]|uniref:DUF3078 domain-containing protein n=1 Tax=Brumimicrobium salinarum TaxID=2058658 RepID=A0A2I0R370_9FLAO|nr:DUF3078 domain-containing protein [Brumimicrobium salinarum]PKR81024.1 hypothetical protein CW751_07610 [Brumimicrobium salinarum]
MSSNFKNYLFCILLVCFITPNFWSQEDSNSPAEEPSNWKLKSIFSLNVTQSSFTNWAAGGRNNVSGLGFINASADYSKNRFKWANSLSTGIGGVQYFDEDLEKTDDIIDLQSTFSYGLKDPWYISLLGGFRTQYLDGYSNPEDSIRSSTFMAPGYVSVSLGIEYIPNDNLKILLSPLSGKFTFVNDQTLANEGAFGVAAAEYNSLGQLTKKGENFRAELGSYFRVIYQKELMENINLKSRLELFSSYINNPQNIDVNGELILDFKINKWFSANLQLNVIYDDDVEIEDRNGNKGPRTQFKQVIGLGIAYRLANFKEEKD